MRLLAAVVFALIALPTWGAQQVFIDLFTEPRQSHAVVGPGGSTWVWPGTALSAHVQTLWFSTGQPTASWVRAVIIWNPRGNAANGVRVLHMDDGPTNLTALFEATGRTESTPVVDAGAITTEWNALVTGLTSKHLGWQTKGNPYVFKVTIEVVPY
jgi:hypothetical protein